MLSNDMDHTTLLSYISLSDGRRYGQKGKQKQKESPYLLRDKYRPPVALKEHSTLQEDT